MCGGVALVYVSQPLDTVKVKMQTFPHLYKGMVDCLVKTYRNDGFYRGLYAGTMPAIAANVAENSVLFAAYGGCQSLMAKIERQKDINDLSPLSNATAGFLAAFFSSFSLCPTELIKCKLQGLREVQTGTSDSKNSTVNRISPFRLTHSIIKEEGIRGLFRGLTSTLAREMPGYFFFFGGYETSRELLRKPGQTKNDIGPINTMISGAVGGVVLWAVIFPADVIKSRIQIYNLPGGLFSIGRDIVRKEGVLALYNGLKPTLIRTIPATAVLFVVFEYTKKVLTNIFIT
ncbi:Mitochondrial ornithine transporter 1 [Pseudolycoriella hygida]|uniref:Mitochondrial ornithine transporter 1 n=1 Tax=Pseudolycoriella hygida TaxID=35572 RepID=A0A9Q0MTQ6_9DIPT|nr:Mitochondrial ornithine transporter 1 [Pseudolycoriella hygida]